MISILYFYTLFWNSSYIRQKNRLYMFKAFYTRTHYLDNIVKDLEQKEHQVMIGGRWEKEPWRTKCLQEMQQFRTGHHG